MLAPADAVIQRHDGDDPPSDQSTAGSPRSPYSTCSRPPSSLLIERSPSSPSTSERAADEQHERDMLASSPKSPAQRPSEPSALRPSFDRPLHSYSSVATTLASRDAHGRATKSYGDIPLNTSRHHFGSHRPVGDPVLAKSQSFRLEFPPPSRDLYPKSGESLFKPMNTANSVDVEKLLEKYSEEGAQLVEYLAGQEQAREESYGPVVEARERADSTLAKFLREQRQKSDAARAAEMRARGRVARRRPLSPPPLTPVQQQVIHELEADLVDKMKSVSINHGETEGAIAGFFTFEWDGADQKPPESHRELLYDSGGLDKRLLRPPLVAHPELGEKSYLEGMTKPLSQSAYQESLDKIRSKNRSAYNKAFWRHWQQAPASKIEPALAPKADSSHSDFPAVLVPDWFPVFSTYNILDLWPGSPASRFTQLLNTIRALELQCQVSRQKPPRWDKEWHDPSSLWDTVVQKKNGG
ncbi:hypothetical protein G7Z17_g9898 [Cylindrodendrum hubeiense]|uniref:Uncharacterized protein n=1 Tax=Cylindrodendrum hubeiense TaxID=595255 RepID=A0A9P5H442_9HYPO|nr:hypothetical protein G7Z17_g9898 [Cylindrodendrum hubeiense]